MERLIINSAKSSLARVFSIRSDSTTIGRHPCCDVVLNNAAVSREHARITKRDDGTFYLEDLQSRNGVWLNDERIVEPTPIYDRDSIRIGDATLVFSTDADAGADVGARRSRGRSPFPRFGSSETLCWREDDDDRPNIASRIAVGDSSCSCSGTTVGRRTACEYEREIALLEDRVRVLLEFARILGKAEDVEDLTPRFLANLLRLFPTADSACVLAPESESEAEASTSTKQTLRLVHFRRRDESDRTPFHISRSIIKHVVANRVGVVSDSSNDDANVDPSASVVQYRISSAMAAPIYDVATDALVGVIHVDARRCGKRFQAEDLRLLVAVANQVAVYLENQKYRDALVQRKMASRELQVATQVQRGFLPVEPPQIDGFEFFDYYRAAKFVGGDYFDYIPLPDGKLAIALGDVSGKGVSASLLMAKLSSETRYGLLLEKSFAAAVARLNRVYADNHWGGRFVTFVLIVLDPATATLRVYNAGHVYPLVAKADGSVEPIGEGNNGFPLGIVADAEYPETVYRLGEGDAVALMSDGLTDAVDAAGNSFDEKRVVERLRNPDGLDAEALGSRLVAAVQQFAGTTPQADDQCLVVFRRKPANDARENDANRPTSVN